MLAKLTKTALTASSQIKERLYPTSDAVNSFKYPGDLCCTVYDGENYQGWMKTYCLDSDHQDKWIDLTLDSQVNNDISSLSCGKNVEILLCDGHQWDYCGEYEGLRGAGNFKVADSGMDDDASTIRLSYYDPMESPAVTLFYYHDCNGSFGALHAPTEYGVYNEYTVYDAQELNVPNNNILSAYIPYGLSLTMYDGSAFDGESKTLDGS